MLASALQCTGQPPAPAPPKSYPARHVDTAKAEEPCGLFQITFSAFMIPSSVSKARYSYSKVHVCFQKFDVSYK